MSSPVTWSISVLYGALLGALFFGGLWWTVRIGVRSRAPALWFIASLLLRTLIAVGGIYAFAHDDWRRLLGCLGGFLIPRSIVTFMVRPRRTFP